MRERKENSLPPYMAWLYLFECDFILTETDTTSFGFFFSSSSSTLWICNQNRDLKNIVYIRKKKKCRSNWMFYFNNIDINILVIGLFNIIDLFDRKIIIVFLNQWQSKQSQQMGQVVILRHRITCQWTPEFVKHDFCVDSGRCRIRGLREKTRNRISKYYY